MIRKILDKMIIYLGLFLMFGIIFIPDLRSIIGNQVGELMNPLLLVLPLHIIIFILAAITGLYASLIQKYTMDWELMRRVQERSRVMQKELRQAQLTNNAAKMKKLQAQQAEMMEDQMAMMKQQFKPMLYISIISIPLFFWVYLAIANSPNASVIFPFWGEHKLTDKVFWEIQYWLFWYFICSMPVSQITRKALNIGGM